MIYPGGARPRGGAPRSSGPRGGRGKRKAQPVVQWKQRNVQQGLVLVDETQLSKLIKREPVQRFYELDPEPFATGQFASLRRCRSRETGQMFAAKFSSRTRYGEDCSAEIHHEIALLSLCSPSQRIVRLHDVFETPAEIIIVLEYAPGGDLQSIIDDNQVPFEADVVKFVRQLVEGLVYLHDRKIAHLDIKPQNLVMMADFPECDIKICDFEISRVILEGTEIREILGTPDYVAPEILHYEPITLAADMWSLGVTTYVLLTGFSPFGGETDQETFCNISKAQLDFPEELFEDVSDAAQDFIKRLLVRDPKSRPTAKECLRHPWFASHVPATTLPRCDSPQAIKGSHSVLAQKNLRKYLSKSREALFERVVQQQQQQQNRNSLRKSTLLSQLNKTRLCESQISLVSKSRERLFMADHQLMMSPSFSRSREKLYGLRSLSKSHEVLDFCRTAMGGASQAPQDAAGLIKTLTRATTTDLSMLPVIRQKQLQSYTRSSTTSIPSTVASEVTTPESKTEKLSQRDKSDTNAASSLPQNTTNDKTNIADAVLQNEVNSSSIIEIPIAAALLSPQLLKETLKNQIQCPPEQQQFHETTATAADKSVPHSKHILNGFTEDTEVVVDITNNCESHAEPTDSIKRLCTSADDSINKLNSVIEADSQCEQEEQFDSLETVNSEDYTVTSESGSEMDKIVNDSANKSATDTDKESEESDEPRFTVAQLVSAFNRHQEVITKTSLEVTMTANDKETKIPQLVGTSNSKFPTGPNALRLFIPGIDITAPSKKKEKKKRTVVGKTQHPDNVTCDAQFSSRTQSTNNDNLTVLENDTTQDNSSSYQGTTTNDNLDKTNNNCKKPDEDSICHLVIEPPPHENFQEKKDTADNCEIAVNNIQGPEDLSCYSRSESMSSDTSESRTPSDCYSSMDTCWDEPAATNHGAEAVTEIPLQRSTENNTVVTGGAMPTGNPPKMYPWGKLCTGSYTRAIEKFGGKVQETVSETKARPLRKSFIHVPTPRDDTNERVRRKSSPVIKPYFYS